MRIAMAGTGFLGAHLLRPLLESSHEVVAVLQNGRRIRGIRRFLKSAFAHVFTPRTSPVGLAKSHGIPIIWLDKMTEQELAPLRSLAPDLILVGGFSIIFKRPLLDLPRIGCVNCHSALLPKHRGPNPLMAALIAGEEETGVTFHVMNEGIDTGDILVQHTLSIGPRDSTLTLYKKTSILSGEHVVELMDRIEREGLDGTPQNPDAGSYEKKLTRAEAGIRWEDSAENIERFVRACTGVLFPHFYFRGRRVYLAMARFSPQPVDESPGTVIATRPRVRVATGAGTLAITAALSRRPIPWAWPAPWNRPRIGEVLD